MHVSLIVYSWFETLILLSFYFHKVLQHLHKFLVQKGFSHCERMLEFPGFCVTQHLADGQLLFGLKHY